MKVFEDNRAVNFIDENNIFVGFDMDACCCETYGWFLSQHEIKNINDISEVILFNDIVKVNNMLQNFIFDLEYKMKEITSNDIPHSSFDAGALVIFRLITKSQQHYTKFYLHLFNIQNGFYGHQLLMKSGNEKIIDTYI